MCKSCFFLHFLLREIQPAVYTAGCLFASV
nr:MAG TPA: hypothetical protein [Caudoviricetes sp.]